MSTQPMIGTAHSLVADDIADELARSLRSMLQTHAPWQDVLAGTERESTTDLALWKRIAQDQGLTGLAIPEELGGAGASWVEVAVVMEELGRAVAPVPYFTSAVLATALLLESGDRELLPKLASGESIAAVAIPFATNPYDMAGPAVTVSGDSLSGTVGLVAGAIVADILLVPTADGIYVVQASDAQVRPVISLDMARQLADITLDGARGARVGDRDALDKALRLGAAMLASEQVGLTQGALDTAVAYMKQRYQFGRLIGSYQALKHRMADVFVSLSQLRAAAIYAAACAGADDPDLPVATAVAQALGSVVAVKAAEECLQMHGGIGFTWENQSHLYLKRAKADSLAFGRADQHRAALGEIVNLPS